MYPGNAVIGIRAEMRCRSSRQTVALLVCFSWNHLARFKIRIKSAATTTTASSFSFSFSSYSS